jgi:2-oxoglutarate/2-oxoacid ferredoxin oxidoreductase subunit beta
MREQVLKYMKQDKLPHVFCPGCGNGTVMNAMFQAIEELQLDPTEILIVGGIGCSSRIATYTIFDSIHTLHGRAIPFAIGAKLANPSLKVIVITGDGDSSSIGGNHLIHAARRNMPLNVFIVNNHIYGMTGGQFSPTTPVGSFTTTSPCGHVEEPFSIVDLLVGAGAPFVARTSVLYFKELVKMMKMSLQKESFSAIDIFTQCPTNYGRSNHLSDPYKLLKMQSDMLVPKKKYDTLSVKEQEEVFVRGIVRDIERPSFMDHYKACVLLTRRGVRR